MSAVLGNYIGGPLDGQPVTGRASVWRDETGTPVATVTGDRRFLGPGQRPAFYVLVDDEDNPHGAGRRDYVHASTYRDLRRNAP